MGCKFEFKTNSILKHIESNKNCKNVYNSKNLTDLKQRLDRIRCLDYTPRQPSQEKAEKYLADMSAKELKNSTATNSVNKIQCNSCKRNFEKGPS